MVTEAYVTLYYGLYYSKHFKKKILMLLKLNLPKQWSCKFGVGISTVNLYSRFPEE